MFSIGLVSNDATGMWPGGRYYLQHLVKSVASLPEEERVPLADVWWCDAPETDPFSEVRENISQRVVLRFPQTLAARAKRKLSRLARRDTTARDLFLAAGIRALFPIQPCCSPGVPLAYWLSDLQYQKWMDFLSSETYEWFETYNSANVARAAIVVLSSKDSLADYERTFPEHVSKARVMNFASLPDASWWALDPTHVAASRSVPGKFFLVGNQFNQYKNHEVVFEATRILKDRGTDVAVVCTGSTQSFAGNQCYARLAEYLRLHNLSSHIFILGMLPRAEQIALIRRSIAILQPSKCEGWSTVIEDGRTLGKPMIVSDIAVNREQLGRSFPNFCAPSDANSWAEQMHEFWGRLGPGPDLESEFEAVGLAKARAMGVGRRFVSIMREAVEADERPS